MQVGTSARAHAVLWLVIMQTGKLHGRTSPQADLTVNQKSNQEATLSLWAIDGLAGVVLGGAFATAAGGGSVPSAPMHRRLPRAMLWGRHQGKLAWPGKP